MKMITEPPIHKAEPVADLTKAAPVEIDLRRARLDSEQGQYQARIAGALDAVHGMLGEKPLRQSRRAKVWRTDHDDAVRMLRERVADAKNEYTPLGRGWSAGQGRSTLGRLDEARAALSANQAEAAVLDAEYERRPWRRYIAVTDGHIHSGIWCKGGTIRPTTGRNWFPWISGWEVADAVDALGPLLCTHCFSDAPTEWTLGKPKPKHCEGSGKHPVEGSRSRVGMRYYGRCAGCSKTELLTSNYVVRAHKPKDEKADSA